MNAEAIAIVGISCRLPGANDTGSYWSNLRAGRDTVTRFSAGQLLAAGIAPDQVRHPGYVPARGLLDAGDCFDHAFFGFTRAQAQATEPQHRVFLECAAAALDDAGIDPQRFGGWIGVFAGCDVPGEPGTAGQGDELANLIGRDKDYLVTQVAYKLGLRGPAVTVQTACSTSLVATHLACQSLLGYECDAVLAGGVSLTLPQTVGYLYQDGHILSRDGRCRPFDAQASGTVPSGGAGVVVLRRLADALADGDRVIAVIRGSAINNDGSEKIGYTAPSVAGQREVIGLAHARADVDPRDISYVEAHGTGTRLGDPMEVAALAEAFGASPDRPGPCWLGAVKANIGHTGSAAGVAGLIKTALMLRQRELVPTAHFSRPNPELRLESTPFLICAESMPWPKGPELAGVSSFGIGGTNAHAILESPPQAQAARRRSRSSRLLCLSAASPKALDELRTGLATALGSNGHANGSGEPDLADVGWTLASGRRQFPCRLSVVASDRAEAATALNLAVPSGTPAVASARVVFLFPGQGTLYPGAGRAAYEVLPEFRRIFDDLRTETLDRFGLELRSVLDPDLRHPWPDDTEHQQLALFALGYALAGQFLSWGVEPAAMVGHSIGEYVAATVAGVWDVSDALAIVHRRGQAMRETKPGAMIAVALSADRVAEFIDGDPDLALAVDASGHCVVSGASEPIAALVSRLKDQRLAARPLSVNRAFHSPLMEPAATALREVMATITASPARFPLISTLTGDRVEPERLLDPRYWSDHLLGTVRLREAFARLLKDTADAFCELGPGESMVRDLRRHRSWAGTSLTLSVLGRSAERERTAVMTALGHLWERGAPVEVTELFRDADPLKCALPPHPFERTRFEPGNNGQAPAARIGPRTQVLAPDKDQGALAVEHHWGECPASTGPAPDVVLPIGDLDTELRRLFAVTDLAPLPCEIGALDGAADHAALRGASAPAIVVALPGDAGDELLDALERLSVRARGQGIDLEIATRGVVSLLGEGTTVPAILAWARYQFRGDDPPEPSAVLARGDDPPEPSAVLARGDDPPEPPAGRVRLLDIGTSGGCPARPPRPISGAAVYAWRMGRWWALEPRLIEVTAGPVSAGPVSAGPAARNRTFAVMSPRAADAAAAAGALAERGLRVGTVLSADGLSQQPSRPGSLVRDLPVRPENAMKARLSGHPDLRAWLDTYSIGLIGRFVCQGAGLRPGDELGEDELRRRLASTAIMPRFLGQLLGGLEMAGWLQRGGDTLTVASDIGSRIDTALGHRDRLGDIAGLCGLLDYCAGSYPGVFAGERDPVSVLFPGGSEELLRAYLADNRIAIGDADECLDIAGQVTRAFQPGHRGPLRVLEVGAGSGELTWRLMDGWRSADVHYRFTDISPLRVREARSHAASAGIGNLTFSTFDIAADPLKQGLPAGTFDLVVAYNVIHLAPSIRTALRNLNRLLASGGCIAIIELTQVPLWMHMIWGLAPGWWDFDDDLRNTSIHLDPPGWQHVLAETGFCEVTPILPGEGADHVVLLAAAAPMPERTEPIGRYRRELARQASGGNVEGLLGLIAPDADEATDYPGLWAQLRAAAPDLPAWLVTADPVPGRGWRGERDRRALDPPPGEDEPGWRHIEVPSLDVTVLAAVPALLADTDFPVVSRLEPPGRAVGRVTPAGVATESVAAESVTGVGVTGPKAESANVGPANAGPANAGPANAGIATPGSGDAGRRDLGEIWCQVLGVPDVRDDDDFFDRGGESLMALHLAALVRDRLGREIAITAFTARPTFGHLVELAEMAADTARRTGPHYDPNVLVLRDTGSRPPLFLAAPAAGSSLCYRGLAQLLGDDQPCYGLESPGLHDGARPLRRIEDIARYHVDQLRRVRPNGPYVLGGWSIGALVAHEMARQLDRAGQRVNAVLGVDFAVVSTAGLPLGFIPGIAIRGIWYECQLGIPGLRGEGRLAGIGEAGDIPGGPKFAAVFHASIAAMLRYRPAPCSSQAVMFSTADRRSRDRLRRRAAPMYRTGVEVRGVSGNHWTVLTPPHVIGLADEMQKVLTEPERSGDLRAEPRR